MFMNEAIKEIATQGKAVNPDPLVCNREVGHAPADTDPVYFILTSRRYLEIDLTPEMYSCLAAP
jgi:hypothetical protein